MTDRPADSADAETDTETGPASPEGETIEAAADLSLRAAVLELEKHAAESGWDQPARLFALVPTADLLKNEPSLAEVIEVDPDADLTGSLTPIEQEPVGDDEQLEELLTQVIWPAEVHGTAAIVERLVLPPSVGEIPDDPEAAAELAQNHPDRQEVRIVAGATRTGTTYCALRVRSHDDDFAVIEGTDLVPSLLQLLLATLEQ